MSASLADHPPRLESHDAPIHAERVSLRVRDLDRVGRFYRGVIGLQVVADEGGTLHLGNDGVTLLTLLSAPDAPSAPAGTPGLFHTAFLLPRRRDLARWLHRAAANGWAIEGMSDHGVSEAIYLSDPEGNGIEIYRDRPRAEWLSEGRSVRMTTEPLDVRGLFAAIEGEPSEDVDQMPPGARIGHVHLSVADLDDARRAITGDWGFDETASRRGAAFFSTGGYHHHLAANTWGARGPMRREPDQLGLAEVVLDASDAAHRLALADRWLAAGGRTKGDAVAIEALGGIGFRLGPSHA